MRRRAVLCALTVLLAATACTADGDGDTASASKEPGPARTLRVLASSELSDMKPVLDAAREATGITVRPTYVCTLDGAETVSSGKADGAYDAVWLSSNDYPRLDPSVRSKLSSETPVMTSPVALGVKAASVERLGRQPDEVTWSQVHRAVADGKLTYGMTDPVRSGPTRTSPRWFRSPPVSRTPSRRSPRPRYARRRRGCGSSSPGRS